MEKKLRFMTFVRRAFQNYSELAKSTFCYFCVATVYLFLLFKLNGSLFEDLNSTYGLSDTDTEGTLWWLWNQSQTSQIDNLSGGQVFDTSQFTFWNLFDYLRIFLVGSLGVENLFLISNASLLICFTLNGIAAFSFARVIFKNNITSAAMGSILVFTSVNLLSLRTSLSNNLLFFGILLIRTFALDFIEKNKRNTYLLVIFCIFTAMSSTYLAANILLIQFVFILVVYSSSSVVEKKSLIVNFLLASSTSLLTTLIIYRDQIFLISRSQKTSEMRPLNALSELIPSSVTIANKFQASSGFLSLTILMVLCIATFLSFGRLKLSKQVLLSLGVMISGLVTQFIGYDFWLLNPIHDLYFTLFPQLRGISNYAKFGQFLIGLGATSLILIHRPKLLAGNIRFALVSLVIAATSAFQSVPADQSFSSRSDVKTIKRDFEYFFGDKQKTLIFDYPDRLSNAEWGFPVGYMQISQIFHNQLLLNGIDYPQHKKGCVSTIKLGPTETINWVDRNQADYIVLRTRLIPKDELEEIKSLLGQRDWKFQYKSYSQPKGPSLFELSKDFEVYKSSSLNLSTRAYICNYDKGDIQ